MDAMKNEPTSPPTDDDATAVIARQAEVAQLFEEAAQQLSRRMRAQVRSVAERVFGLSPEMTGPVQPGEALGPYRVVRLLGVGGQASVYEAVHGKLGRRVALKVPRPDTASRLLKEARVAVHLEAPDVVRTEDLGEDRGIAYLVMEYCAGGNLQQQLETYPEGLPESRIRAIADAVLRALAYAHRQGVVHRDVKPANVLFDDQGQAKLADLGLGTMAAPRDHRTPELSLTDLDFEQDLIAGTPMFMAPEQEDPGRLAGAPLDGRADLFSFGKMLFVMLTGASPRTVRPPSRMRRSLSPAWDDVVFDLLEEDRDRRTPTADAARAAIAAVGQVEPAPAAPAAGEVVNTPPLEHPPGPLGGAVVHAGMAALAGGTAAVALVRWLVRYGQTRGLPIGATATGALMAGACAHLIARARSARYQPALHPAREALAGGVCLLALVSLAAAGLMHLAETIEVAQLLPRSLYTGDHQQALVRTIVWGGLAVWAAWLYAQILRRALTASRLFAAGCALVAAGLWLPWSQSFGGEPGLVLPLGRDGLALVAGGLCIFCLALMVRPTLRGTPISVRMAGVAPAVTLLALVGLLVALGRTPYLQLGEGVVPSLVGWLAMALAGAAQIHADRAATTAA